MIMLRLLPCSDIGSCAKAVGATSATINRARAILFISFSRSFVMAGLVTASRFTRLAAFIRLRNSGKPSSVAIHVFCYASQDVDARGKRGHDGKLRAPL